MRTQNLLDLRGDELERKDPYLHTTLLLSGDGKLFRAFPAFSGVQLLTASLMLLALQLLLSVLLFLLVSICCRRPFCWWCHAVVGAYYVPESGTLRGWIG